MGPKYEFTEETITHNGRLLHRIKNLKTNELGGWIEKEDNLSQEDNCWVEDEAKVYDKALVAGESKISNNAEIYEDAYIYDGWVYGNAKVYGQAEVFTASVFDDAQVYGESRIVNYAKIYENAQVYGHAKVKDSSKVYGNAKVYENARIGGEGAEVYGNAQVYGDALLLSYAEVYENAKVFGNVIVERSVKIYGDIEVKGKKKIKSNMYNTALLKATKTSTNDKISNILKLVKYYPNHRIPIDEDGHVEFTVIQITKENIVGMDSGFESQLRSEGKYGWYMTCTAYPGHDITMQNLAIFGDPNRWVTKWMYYSKEDAVKQAVTDKYFNVYHRIVEYPENAKILEELNKKE